MRRTGESSFYVDDSKRSREAIGCEWKMYYLVSMSFIEAVHVRGSVKIITESLEEFCAERENEKAIEKEYPAIMDRHDVANYCEYPTERYTD